MAYAPDKDDPFPKPKPGHDNNGGGNSTGGSPKMGAFQPGQLNALAAQLSGGFGGSMGAWKRDMRKTYDPTPMKEFNFGGGHGGGNGGRNNNGGGNNPGTGPKPGDGGFDPASPRNRMMPMQMNAQQPMMMPQMGLLAGQMQAQQPQQQQQQNQLGDMPSYVLDFIRSRGV